MAILSLPWTSCAALIVIDLTGRFAIYYSIISVYWLVSQADHIKSPRQRSFVWHRVLLGFINQPFIFRFSNIPGQFGWDFEQPDLVDVISAYCKEVEPDNL